MLPLQFYGQNLHFAISLLAALVCFAVFWLYFDAWTSKKEKKDIYKWVGFLLVSLSFLAYSTVVQRSLLGSPALGNFSTILTDLLRVFGYACIIMGQVIEPLQHKPNLRKLEQEDPDPPNLTEESTKVSAVFGAKSAFGFGFLLPIGAAAVALLYWRRATKGLERHLRPVAIGFSALAIFEVFSLTQLWSGTTNPFLYNLVKSFGPFWTIEQLALLGAAFILGRWVWSYLVERFMSQLFMIFTTMTLGIFLLTTISYTFLLMGRIQSNSLDNLQTAASVLSYALDSKKAESLANAETIAQNGDVARAAVASDHAGLVKLTASFLDNKKQSTLMIVGQSAQVLLRAENTERWGDSVSTDTLVRRALIGKANSSLSTVDGVLAPKVYIRSATPIRDASNNIVGTVVVGLLVDNAFTDGIKDSTGLDSAIYASNIRSATTFVAPDGKTRWVGVKEQNATVRSQVLGKGKMFRGNVGILNRQYLGVYQPLRDVDGSVVGMLFIGQPQTTILQTAGRSIQLTFMVAVTLLVLSIIPAYFFSKYLAEQIS